MRVILDVVDNTNKRRSLEYPDIDPCDLVENLMVLLEIESGIAVVDQHLTVTKGGPVGRVLLSHSSLIQQGVHGAEVELALCSRSRAQLSSDDASRLVTQLFAQGSATPASSSRQPDPNSVIEQLFQQSRAQPAFDPDDPDTQRRAYEEIQRRNLEENFVQAMEHTPEAFGRVVMLYVPCKVNNVPLTAFVDSGAQMSVMSEKVAEQCGIMRLLDRRMAGVAKGVGTCKILGKVHMTMVMLGGLVLPFSITVLERQDMDFLIGLDQLKRHQMMIDLKDNCLRIDDIKVSFMSEGELPIHLRKESAGENEEEQAAESSIGAAAAPAATATTAPPKVIPPEIQRLMELSGATEVMAREAMTATNGDEDAAALLLLGD